MIAPGDRDGHRWLKGDGRQPRQRPALHTGQMGSDRSRIANLVFLGADSQLVLSTTDDLPAPQYSWQQAGTMMNSRSINAIDQTTLNNQP